MTIKTKIKMVVSLVREFIVEITCLKIILECSRLNFLIYQSLKSFLRRINVRKKTGYKHIKPRIKRSNGYRHYAQQIFIQ